MAVVLIVEDEEQVRVLAEAIIQDLGHETLTAGTAEQALAVVQERSDVDVLFTDIGCSRLRRRCSLQKALPPRSRDYLVPYTTARRDRRMRDVRRPVWLAEAVHA